MVQVFTDGDATRPVTLLVVDEIDCLSTRKQEVLYNLFEWPSIPTSKLLVVGIANTMDLPERLLPKIKSRASLERVDFAAYTKSQVSALLFYVVGWLVGWLGWLVGLLPRVGWLVGWLVA